MKKSSAIKWLLIITFFLLYPFNNCKSSCGSFRLISLCAFQKQIHLYQTQGTYLENILHFANVNRIIGCLVDYDSDDLIVIGEVNPNLPPLLLEDFIIAFRSAWSKYRSYSNPICSIDPNPDVVQRLQRLANLIISSRTIEQAENRIKEWKRICQNPQNVVVKGIPFNSHFANVLVKADYDMKSIADGSDSLAITGFNSLTDMIISKIRDDIIHNRPVRVSLSMNRFWFCSGLNSYNEDEGIVLINECPVKLLTEQMYSSGGSLVGSGGNNPLASQFANNFTSHYKEVSQERPIYTELENLFRFIALANIIKYKYSNIIDKASLDLILNEYIIPETNVATQLPGRSNVKRFQHRIDFQGGYQEAHLWLPTCGGVDMSIKMNPNLFHKMSRGLSSLRKSMLNSRPSSDAVYWDYTYDIDSYITQHGEKAFLEYVNKINKSCHVIAIEDKPSGFKAINGKGQALYDGADDKSAFITAIKDKVNIREDKTIYLYMQTPVEELKLDAFAKAMKLQQHTNNTNYRIIVFRDIYRIQHYFLNEAKLIDISSPKYENGKWTATIEVLLNRGSKFIRVVFRIFAKTIEIADNFIKKIKTAFTDENLKQHPISDIVNDVIGKMKKELNISGEELKIIIEDECKGKNVVIIPFRLKIYNV